MCFAGDGDMATPMDHIYESSPCGLLGIWQRRWIMFMRVCDVLCFYGPPQEVVVEYKGERAFASLARELDVMSDFKAGVPRTSYMGVVSVWMHDIKVHLAPIGLKSSFSPSVR